MRLIVPATYALSLRTMNSNPSLETSVTYSDTDDDIGEFVVLLRVTWGRNGCTVMQRSEGAATSPSLEVLERSA